MASHSSNDNDSSTAGNTDLAGSSRIPNFFRMPIAERISALHQRGLISNEDVQLLSSGNHQVQLNVADKMIENVVGVFGLPMGIALTFLINKISLGGF